MDDIRPESHEMNMADARDEENEALRPVAQGFPAHAFNGTDSCRFQWCNLPEAHSIHNVYKGGHNVSSFFDKSEEVQRLRDLISKAIGIIQSTPFAQFGTRAQAVEVLQSAFPDAPKPIFQECPVCHKQDMVRLTPDWANGKGIPIIGCGNPWHYAVPDALSLGDRAEERRHRTALALGANAELDQTLAAEADTSASAPARLMVCDDCGGEGTLKLHTEATGHTRIHPKPSTACCGYYDFSAVRWNPYNKVIQCHNCGQVWEPRA